LKPFHFAFALCAAVPVAALLFHAAAGDGPSKPIDGPWNRPLDQRRADPFPRTFSNHAGDCVVVDAPAQRIVSGTVFTDALLLRICPPTRVLALHHLSTDVRYSPVAAESGEFTAHHRGSPEEILALSPDLVILSSFSREETRRLLSRTGCPVLRFQGFASVEDIQSNMRAFGYMIGRDEEAERLVDEMNATLDQAAAGRSNRRAWRLLLYEAGRTAGSGTTFDSLMNWVGASNAALELALVGSQGVAPEQVLALDPDALVVGVVPGGEDAAMRGLEQTPGFQSLAAVRAGRVVFVPAGRLLSTSHHLARAATRISEVLDEWGSP